MNLKRFQTLALAVVLVGCGSSGDETDGDEGSQTEAKPNKDGNEKPSEAATAGSGASDEMLPDENEAEPDEDNPDEMAPDEVEDPGEAMMIEDMTEAFPDIRGVGCSLDTGFPGDEVCLAPPAEGEGMQLHVGPANYDDPAEIEKFIFHPGQEASQCWTIHTPNDEDIYYRGFVMSGRPGTHHIINTMYKSDKPDGGFTMCSDGGTGTSTDVLGTLPGASKAYMPRRPVAPENEGLGRPVPAHTPAQADMHYFNFTEDDILREFWMNIYYVPKEQVTETPNLIRGMGGFGWQITPGTDKVYQYAAPITSDGRITQLLGHYHAHGVRFTGYLLRASGEQEKVFEMYDYLDPLIFDYNSVEENPEFSDNAGGAHTGMLEVKAGDVLQWECHIINDSEVTLRYVNEVKTGEMCNIWGESVGPAINSVLFAEEPFEIQ